MLKYETEIREAAINHKIPFELLYAQVGAESSFDPEAVSHCGARGLLQLMPVTGHEMGLQEDQFFNVEKNLNAGAAWLHRQHFTLHRVIETLKGAQNCCIEDDYWMMALAAYNGGSGYVIKAIRLCVEAPLSVRWANISLMLYSPKCEVRGKHPDHKQICDYVAKIFKKYKSQTTP